MILLCLDCRTSTAVTIDERVQLVRYESLIKLQRNGFHSYFWPYFDLHFFTFLFRSDWTLAVIGDANIQQIRTLKNKFERSNFLDKRLEIVKKNQKYFHCSLTYPIESHRIVIKEPFQFILRKSADGPFKAREPIL